MGEQHQEHRAAWCTQMVAAPETGQLRYQTLLGRHLLMCATTQHGHSVREAVNDCWCRRWVGLISTYGCSLQDAPRSLV